MESLKHEIELQMKNSNNNNENGIKKKQQKLITKLETVTKEKNYNKYISDSESDESSDISSNDSVEMDDIDIEINIAFGSNNNNNNNNIEPIDRVLRQLSKFEAITEAEWQYFISIKLSRDEKLLYINNILSFWNNKKYVIRLPNMRKVALNVVITMAGSTPAEEMFSLFANIVTPQSSNLSHSHVSMTHFLADDDLSDEMLSDDIEGDAHV